MSSANTKTQYSSESSATIGRAAKSRLRPSPPLTPELTQKVTGWLETQPSVSPFHSIATKGLDEKDGSSTSSSFGKKAVHWTLDVVDTEKKSRHATNKKRSSGKLPSSKSRVRKSVPLAPEPPSPHAPPPTPRFQRLPTPELSDVECGDFCYCCSEVVVDKVSAQSMRFSLAHFAAPADFSSGCRTIAHGGIETKVPQQTLNELVY